MNYPLDIDGNGLGIVTPGELLGLALDVPELGASIQLWQNGKVTWEQAMMIAVKALAESNKHARIQIREMILHSIPNYTVEVKPD